MLHTTSLSLPRTRFLKKSHIPQHFFPQWQRTFSTVFKDVTAPSPRFPFNKRMRNNCHILSCPGKKTNKKREKQETRNIFLLFPIIHRGLLANKKTEILDQQSNVKIQNSRLDSETIIIYKNLILLFADSKTKYFYLAP